MKCKDVYWSECNIDDCQCDERISRPRKLGETRICNKYCELCWLYCDKNPTRLSKGEKINANFR